MSASPRYIVNLKLDPLFRQRVRPAVLRSTARAALQDQHAPVPSELTIHLTGDGELRRLNAAYLGHDYPTDVLSFPDGEPDPANGRLYLGDIAISFPQARRQAQLGGHPVQAELQLLVVHAVLHLLGHDHAVAGEKARMWAAQAAILSEIKAGIAGPPDETGGAGAPPVS
jgi:rRNA maturation RNase YbeY